MTVSDEAVSGCVTRLTAEGIESTPSGIAGLAAVMLADDEARAALGLGNTSSVLTIVSEAPSPD